MSELKDMRVVITGASSGFGSVAAKLLVDHGCKVTLVQDEKIDLKIS